MGVPGPRLFPGTHGHHLPSRLNGSSLENDAFSDKSERENAEESDAEAQDHSRKTESGSDQSETPGRPVRRGTTYVEQAHEELGEVRARPAWSPGHHPSPHPWSLKWWWPCLAVPWRRACRPSGHRKVRMVGLGESGGGP